MAAPSGGKPGDWICPNCGDLVFARNSACRKCGTPKSEPAPMSMFVPTQVPQAAGRPGDWNCPNCGDLVFGSKPACRLCGTPNPGGSSAGAGYGPVAGGKGGKKAPRAKPGDWICSNCGDLVFASRDACKLCGTPKDENSQVVGEEAEGGGAPAAPSQNAKARPGDWICSECNHLNFSRNETCNKCGASSAGSKRLQAKPGDWICPSCGDLVFASKSACKMCGAEKPEDDAGVAVVGEDGTASRGSPY